jgi:phage/conjugal plasmid C-4 type zinc finger TraR family protein
VTDVFDRAQERDAQMLEDALVEQSRRAGLAGKTINDSARKCRVCDKVIPDARRRALPGVQTCVACQADLENAVKGGGY